MKKKILSVIKFIVPVVLLYYIFTIIDFDRLWQVFLQSNKAFVALAFLSFPIKYLFFTIRWKIILKLFSDIDMSFFDLYKIIYKGLFFGYFVPGSLGVDVYRVAKLKHTKTINLNLALIFLEKIIGIVVCAFFVFIFFEAVPVSLSPHFRSIKTIMKLLVFAIPIVLLLLYLLKSTAIINRFFQYIEFFIIRLISVFSKKFKKNFNLDEGFIQKTLQYIFSPKMILYVLLFSVLNQIVSAVIANNVFLGFGEHLNISSNLFANPLLNIFFLLPISFGSIGVREGAYIAIFGLFGVVAEISLLVSFVFFVSTLINISIGGIIFLLDKKNNYGKTSNNNWRSR